MSVTFLTGCPKSKDPWKELTDYTLKTCSFHSDHSAKTKKSLTQWQCKNGRVYFLDDRDKRKVMKVAKRKFKRCKITYTLTKKQSCDADGPDLELGSDPT